MSRSAIRHMRAALGPARSSCRNGLCLTTFCLPGLRRVIFPAWTSVSARNRDKLKPCSHASETPAPQLCWKRARYFSTGKSLATLVSPSAAGISVLGCMRPRSALF